MPLPEPVLEELKKLARDHPGRAAVAALALHWWPTTPEEWRWWYGNMPKLLEKIGLLPLLVFKGKEKLFIAAWHPETERVVFLRLAPGRESLSFYNTVILDRSLTLLPVDMACAGNRWTQVDICKEMLDEARLVEVTKLMRSLAKTPRMRNILWWTIREALNAIRIQSDTLFRHPKDRKARQRFKYHVWALGVLLNVLRRCGVEVPQQLRDRIEALAGRAAKHPVRTEELEKALAELVKPEPAW